MRKIKVLILTLLMCFLMTSCTIFGITIGSPSSEPTVTQEPTVEVTPTPTPVTPEVTPTPEVTLTEIYVKNLSDIYVNVGETYKPNLTVIAKFSDNTEKDITTDVTFSSISTSTKGEQELTISYEGLTIKAPVNVVVPTGIELNYTNAKILYEVGEVIDLSGLIVYRLYEDELKLNAKNYTISITDEEGHELSLSQPLNELGKYTITITVGTYNETYEVNVVEEIVDDTNITYTSLELDTTGTKKEFKNDDEFNYDNLVLNAKKSNNTKELIPSLDYKVELYKGNELVTEFSDEGEYTVKVTYIGDIEFEDKELEYLVNYCIENPVVTFAYSGDGANNYESFNMEITTDNSLDYAIVPEGYYFDGFSTPFDKWATAGIVKIYIEPETNSNKRYIILMQDDYQVQETLEFNVNTDIERNSIEVDPIIIPNGKSFLYWDIPYRFILKETKIVKPIFGPNTIDLASFNVTEEVSVNNVSANAVDINVEQFLASTPEGFSLDSITLGIEGEIVAEIPYEDGMISAYFTNLTANTSYEVGAYYSQNQSFEVSLRKARQLTYRFHFVGFMIITNGDVMYRVRMMYNGDCLYRWYFAEGTNVINYDFYYSFQLPIEYEGYTCIGSKTKVETITSDVDLEAEMILPPGDICTVVFYDRFYPTVKNIIKIVEVPYGGSVPSSEIPTMETYYEGDYRCEFVGWNKTLTNVTTNLFVEPNYDWILEGHYNGEIDLTIGDTYIFVQGQLIDASNVWVCYEYYLYEVSNNNLVLQSYLTELHYSNLRLETGLKADTEYRIVFKPEIRENVTITLDKEEVYFKTRKGTEKLGYSFQAVSNNSYSYGLGPTYVDVRSYVEYTKSSSGTIENRRLIAAYDQQYKKQNTTYYLNPVSNGNESGVYHVYFDNISVTTKNATIPTIKSVDFNKVERGFDLYGYVNDPSEIIKNVWLYYKTTDNSKYQYITAYYSASGSNSVFKNMLELAFVDPDTGELKEYQLTEAYIYYEYIYDGTTKSGRYDLTI